MPKAKRERREQTDNIICSNSGVGRWNSACMKGFAPSRCLGCHQQNVPRKLVWQKVACDELPMLLIPTA